MNKIIQIISGNKSVDMEMYELIPINNFAVSKQEVEELEDEQGEWKFGNITFTKSAGRLISYGIYSSYYEDTEKDILTSSAHKFFSNAVNKGQVPYPDIYIAHIEVPVGKAAMIDYDERGFAVFGAEVYPEWQDVVEEIVVKSYYSGIELGMSHGFYPATVKWDSDGHIIEYISHELSILPVNGKIVKNGKEIKLISASNKYTSVFVT